MSDLEVVAREVVTYLGGGKLNRIESGSILHRKLSDALSQQAEPVNQCDGCQAGVPVDENGNHRMGKPGGYADLMRCEKVRYVSEPAPPQDEREAFANRFPESTNCTRLADVRDGWIAGLEYATRPAQAEQQPVSWQFYQHGKWWNGDDRVKDHRKNTEAAGIPVRDLYAAPIEQQPSVAQQILDLIMNECRYWQGRDEARRGGYACLYAAAKELADKAAPIEQTAPQCNHRFMYFGDQKKRRCADCCVVEGDEQTALSPSPETDK